MNYDEYLDRQVELEYLRAEANMPVSNCCGVYIEDSDINDICTECGEYCVIVTLGEYQYEEYENAMCDKADSINELQRER